MPRERDIERFLVDRAREVGGEIRKVRWIGRRGAPDRVLMVHPARTVWVELKRPGERPEPHQEREHERMRKMGQAVVVIDSFEGVDALIAGIAR